MYDDEGASMNSKSRWDRIKIFLGIGIRVVLLCARETTCGPQALVVA